MNARSDTGSTRDGGAWRRLRAVLIAAAALLVALELASLAALWLLGASPDQSYSEMYRTSRCLKANPFNDGKYGVTPEATQVMFSKIPHPYFGFTVNPERSNIEWRNNLISADYQNESRYRRMLAPDEGESDTFTIGVFGASVAGAFAQHIIADQTFVDRLRSGIPALAGKKIVIRDMAIGSSRQPSQLAIATHYMELLDMTINLDGYSEVAVIQYPDYPIEYPMFADVFYSGGEPSTYLKMRVAEQLCAQISAVPSLVRPLSYSSFYYLFWHSVSKRLNKSLYAPRIPDEDARDAAFTDDEVRELYLLYFQKYTRYQHQILSANGVRSYYFLQPNQYAEGSKRTFSDEEKSGALNYGDQAEIRTRYGLLRDKVGELSDSGVAAFDLTMIYEDVADTIYIDSCCHVNELGNRMIAEAVADVIIEEENARAGSGARADARGAP